ncbi:hypothetical protein H4582DRAFT_1968471 [Lactarius indigo]|nr:hypothetical protein H4582DRAFT_1968471 [Lactarius indigo]
MSGSFSPTQLPPPSPPGLEQSQASALGPGIASLFVQGIETGLVLAQFSQWFSVPERSESPVLSTVVIFVTAVGLAQSGICFASAWCEYVQKFGTFPLPGWEDYVHSIPTLVISFPVQALMIRRCYYILGKNMFIVTPLLLLLVASVVTSLWSIVSAFRFYASVVAEGPLRISWPFLMSVLLPSVLDLTLTVVLLHYLTRTMKRVYASHKRKRISHLVNVAWQSALPPTICAICMSVFYIQFATARIKGFQLWLPIFQQTIGKLYVISLFYMINAQPLQPDERPTTIMSTLTVPTEAMYTFTREAPGRDTSCGDITAERGRERTINFSV